MLHPSYGKITSDHSEMLLRAIDDPGYSVKLRSSSRPDRRLRHLGETAGSESDIISAKPDRGSIGLPYSDDRKGTAPRRRIGGRFPSDPYPLWRASERMSESPIESVIELLLSNERRFTEKTTKTTIEERTDLSHNPCDNPRNNPGEPTLLSELFSSRGFILLKSLCCFLGISSWKPSLVDSPPG